MRSKNLFSKDLVFALVAVVILVFVGYFLFSPQTVSFAKKIQLQPIKPQSELVASSKRVDPSTAFQIDGVFTVEDIAEVSPLGPHKDYLSVEQYASYCKTLQASGKYSKNIHVNAILATKAYIAPEEIPVYEKFLKDVPSVGATTDQIQDNVTMVPEDMHLKIVAACQK